MHQEDWIYTIPLRLRSVFRRKAVEAELDEELQFHLERQIELQIAQGVAPEEARNAALRAVGGMAQIKEECRDMRKVNLLENLMQDLRYAGRTFRKSPGFTAIAVLSLAFGIGTNTAIFSLIDAVLLKSLPVNHPEELAALEPLSPEGKRGWGFSYPAYLDLRDANHVFSGLLAASGPRQIEVGIGADTEPAQNKIVSSTYFSVLGVRPILGRAFNNQDDGLQVAVISHRFWKQSFGGSDSVLGRQIALEGVPFTIVGVAPPGFFGEAVGEAPDIWASVSLEQAQRRNDRGYVWLNLMGRLKPGVKASQAAAELNLILTHTGPANAEHTAVEPGGRGLSGLRDRFTDPLRILMAVVAVVLLIACANLASLLLARATARQREIATRLAIGAGRGRLVRQLLTESVLLAAMGGMLGVLFATWSSRLLLDLVVGGGRPIALDLRPDVRILLFAGMISLVTGMLFGLAPALQAVGRDVAPALKLGARSLAGRGRRWGLKDALIVAQVALSLLLLVVGGLFIRTLQNLKDQDTGFRAGNILSVELGAQRGYQPQWPALEVRLLERMRAIPGVQAASVSFNGTLSDSGSGVGGLKIDGYIPRSPEDQRSRADWVGPGYFETAGIPLLDGRDFTLADNTAAPKVALVNQTLARHYFGNSPAVSRRFEFNKESYEIIGVVKDAKYIDLREPSPRLVYFASLQRTGGIHALEVRTAGSPLAFAGTVRTAIREIDPRLRLGIVTTVQQRIDRKLSREHLVADLAAFFGGLTVLLVAIGIYGTLAYSVAQRTNEIGIRMALGAQPWSVLRMVLRDILLVLAAGLAVGVAAVMACGQLVASMLFGLKPTDATTIALAALVLSAMALAAGYIPARRASRVDPLAALRAE
jgi:predicted permease